MKLKGEAVVSDPTFGVTKELLKRMVEAQQNLQKWDEAISGIIIKTQHVDPDKLDTTGHAKKVADAKKCLAKLQDLKEQVLEDHWEVNWLQRLGGGVVSLVNWMPAIGHATCRWLCNHLVHMLSIRLIVLDDRQ